MSKIKHAASAAALIMAVAVPSTAIARPVDIAFGAAGMLVLMGVGSKTVVAVRRRTRISAATS